MEGLDNQIEDTLEHIRQEIRNYKRCSGVQRENVEGQLADLLRNCKDQIKEYKASISDHKAQGRVGDGQDQGWKRDVQYHKKKVRTLYADYTKQRKLFSKLKDEARKSELTALADEHEDMQDHQQQMMKQKMEDGGEDITNDDIANELFSEVFKIQDENADLVQQLIFKADKANEMAGDINERLDMQNQQLIDISHEMDHLGGIIKRAGREVTSFMRGLATDKIFVVCCCLCCCVIMIAIVSFVICRCYVCTLICQALGEDAIKKCKKIPLLYTASDDEDKKKSTS